MSRELKDLSESRLSSSRSQKAPYLKQSFVTEVEGNYYRWIQAAREASSGIRNFSRLWCLWSISPAVSLGIISIIDMLMVFLCQNIFSKVFSCQNILQREPRLIISKVSTHLFKYNRKSGDSEVSILMWLYDYPELFCELSYKSIWFKDLLKLFVLCCESVHARPLSSSSIL